MTIEDFAQTVSQDTRIKVFDDWGLVGRFDAPELSIKFGEFTKIKSIKSYDYNIIGIKI